MRLSLKAPWKLAIDARVENNGTVFLVYPFSVSRASGWTKTKTYLGVAGGWAISCLATELLFSGWWHVWSTATCGPYGGTMGAEADFKS